MSKEARKRRKTQRQEGREIANKRDALAKEIGKSLAHLVGDAHDQERADRIISCLTTLDAQRRGAQ